MKSTLEINYFTASSDTFDLISVTYEPRNVENMPGSIVIRRTAATGKLVGTLTDFKPSHVTHNDCVLWLSRNGITLALSSLEKEGGVTPTPGGVHDSSRFDIETRDTIEECEAEMAHQASILAGMYNL